MQEHVRGPGSLVPSARRGPRLGAADLGGGGGGAAVTPHTSWFSSEGRIQEHQQTEETPGCERSPEVRLEERGLKETGLTELQMEPKIRLLFAGVLGKQPLM